MCKFMTEYVVLQELSKLLLQINFFFYPGIFQVIIGKAQIQKFSLTNGNNITFQNPSNIQNFIFDGGSISVTNVPKTLNVTGATYLGTDSPKYILAQTTLVTKRVDCTYCGTAQDCALHGWTQIKASNTTNCPHNYSNDIF